MSKKVRFMEIGPKRGRGHMHPWIVPPLTIRIMFISEEQATDYKWN